MPKVINHIEGLCDAKGKRVPYEVSFEGSPEIIELANSKRKINDQVMVTFVKEEKIEPEKAAVDTASSTQEETVNEDTITDRTQEDQRETNIESAVGE